MYGLWAKSLGVSVVGLAVASTASARTVNLTDGSGAAIGWTATIPDAGDDLSIQLSFVRSANLTRPGISKIFNRSINLER